MAEIWSLATTEPPAMEAFKTSEPASTNRLSFQRSGHSACVIRERNYRKGEKGPIKRKKAKRVQVP